ncbi:MAG TPA: hypothetical protein VK860_03200 [Ilumatobacteraceae bacterium]|nr:hypothetical protein [Ilumatobacteraceae bacterium]
MSQPVYESDASMLARFQPILRFTDGEYFLPMAVDDYLRECRLWRHHGRRRTCVAEVGELDRDQLVALTAGRAATWSLQYATDPMSRSEVVAWRLAPERPRFSGASRLGSVGVLGRLIDAVMRLTLLARGRVASGTEARAEMKYRPHRADREHTCYTRLFRQDGYLVLQYWFFYAFNDWRSRAHGVNDHEADWEQVTIFCSERTGVVTPRWVVYSAHDEKGDDLRRRWDDPDITKVGDQVVVFAGLGSHSGAYLAGDYLLTVDRDSLGHLYTLGRRISTVLLPWTRADERNAVGAPYIDYARGDGDVIGEGARIWRREPIDDDTPWVAAYEGLWGHDTEDPLGGERGPAGPRYERGGVVRRSWANPVAWAGLDKVPPDDDSIHEIVERRREELESLLATEREQHERLVDRLRATAAADADAHAAQTAATAQAASLEELAEERRRLDVVVTSERTPAGPHDHLRHRRTPIEVPPTIRRRMLAAWSTVSTPLLLLAIAVLVLPLGSSVASVAIVSLTTIFALEALARRRLVSFLLTAVTVLLAVSIGLSIVIGLLVEWRFTVAALLCIGALVVLVLNLVELRRR